MMVVNFAGQYDFLHPEHRMPFYFNGRLFYDLATALGQLVVHPGPHGWGPHLGLMEDLVFTKFFEDKSLHAELIRVQGDFLIYGNCRCDNFWGKCYCSRCFQNQHKALNYYGEILMRVRDLFVQK